MEYVKNVYTKKINSLHFYIIFVNINIGGFKIMKIDELKASRQSLVDLYESLVDEMAKDSMEEKKPNPKLIEETNMLMNQIRNWDILISIEKQKSISSEKTM